MSPLYLGANQVDKCYLGANEIDAGMLGADDVCGGTKLEAVFRTGNNFDLGDNGTTFSNLNIGDAGDDRYVLVICRSMFSADAVSIGGSAATNVYQADCGNQVASYWLLKVTTGTTATVAVTNTYWGGNVTVHTITGSPSLSIKDTYCNNQPTSTPANVTPDMIAGEIMIGNIEVSGVALGTVTITNGTVDYVYNSLTNLAYGRFITEDTSDTRTVGVTSGTIETSNVSGIVFN